MQTAPQASHLSLLSMSDQQLGGQSGQAASIRLSTRHTTNVTVTAGQPGQETRDKTPPTSPHNTAPCDTSLDLFT